MSCGLRGSFRAQENLPVLFSDSMLVGKESYKSVPGAEIRDIKSLPSVPRHPSRLSSDSAVAVNLWPINVSYFSKSFQLTGSWHCM